MEGGELCGGESRVEASGVWWQSEDGGNSKTEQNQV